MVRFEEVTEQVNTLAKEIQEKYFRDLANVKITYLFDTKKRSSGDRLVLGKCQKTNDMVKHFTIDEAQDEEGYQYVITLDKIAYDNISDVDRVRLIRHELRHILVIETEKKTHYRVNPHDIEDFVDEVELNKDDPGWANRVGQMIQLIYDQMEEEAKDKK